MNRNKELMKNTVIIALGKICTQFISFLLLPIYTRFLSTDEYGSIDLIITSITLIAPILTLQIERSIFRNLIDVRNDKELQNKVLSSSLYTIIPAITISLIVTPLICIYGGLGNPVLMTLLVTSSIVLNVLMQIPRGLGKNLHYSIAGVIVGGLNACISLMCVILFKMGVEGVLLGYIISNLIGSLYIVISMKLWNKISVGRRSVKTLKQMLQYSIPLIPSEIGYWVIDMSDRVILSVLMGASFNGVYATAVKFPALIVSVYNIFNMSWQETVSLHIRDRDIDRYLSKTFDTVMRLFASVCLLMIAVMPFVFNLIIGEEFHDSYAYIAPLCVGSFFHVIIGLLGGVYAGLKKTKEIAKINILTAIINIVVNLALIRFIGVWAAVLSTIIAYMSVAIYRIINIKKDIRIRVNWRTMVLLLTILIISIIIYLNKNIYLLTLNLALSIIMTLLLIFQLIQKSIGLMSNKKSKGINKK